MRVIAGCADVIRIKVPIQREAAGCIDFNEGSGSSPRRSVVTGFTSALEPQQQIHGGLIGRGKAVVLEFR
jgi:hypothetical protein